MAKFFTIFFVFVLAVYSQVLAQSHIPNPNPSIWDLPNRSEDEINIGYWALVIAKECDSSADINNYLLTLDSMASEIKLMVGGRNSDMVKMLMAKTYQFDSGVWNGGNIFAYDLNDPLGEGPNARLLTTYLDTHKGNCVSMPTLFLALMERVDPDVQFNGVAAPLHLFCRLNNRDDSTVWNVESTNGGNPARDVWYIESFAITQTAIDSGIYMRDLTKREYVAELIGIIVSKYRQEENYQKALQYADLMLAFNPRSVNGLVQKGALLAWIGYALQEDLKLRKGNSTLKEEMELKLYKEQSDKFIERARSLGWEPETLESRKEYLKKVRNAREVNSD